MNIQKGEGKEITQGPTQAQGDSAAPEPDRSPDGFVAVWEPHTGRLLMRYDPQRRLVEIARRGIKTLIDLTQFEKRREPAENR